MSSDNASGNEYDPSILHMPENPTGDVLAVANMIKEEVQLRLELKDDRVYTGSFAAFDKFGNFVLTGAKEYFRDEIREMPTVIIPLDFVTKVGSKPAEPKNEEKKQI
ncbi:Sm protein [Histomonas meleagridis]|uniref:Sm protein n=1 Tax=Histomonas meleagridis TaxID=135588 RepID=UPI00355974BA|nr:Sm protein [Histomonas meleagridis]KAH0796783.1 Sm protein [Histomonas meleagridis]